MADQNNQVVETPDQQSARLQPLLNQIESLPQADQQYLDAAIVKSLQPVPAAGVDATAAAPAPAAGVDATAAAPAPAAGVDAAAAAPAPAAGVDATAAAPAPAGPIPYVGQMVLFYPNRKGQMNGALLPAVVVNNNNSADLINLSVIGDGLPMIMHCSAISKNNGNNDGSYWDFMPA